MSEASVLSWIPTNERIVFFDFWESLANSNDLSLTEAVNMYLQQQTTNSAEVSGGKTKKYKKRKRKSRFIKSK